MVIVATPHHAPFVRHSRRHNSASCARIWRGDGACMRCSPVQTERGWGGGDSASECDPSPVVGAGAPLDAPDDSRMARSAQTCNSRAMLIFACAASIFIAWCVSSYTNTGRNFMILPRSQISESIADLAESVKRQPGHIRGNGGKPALQPWARRRNVGAGVVGRHGRWRVPQHRPDHALLHAQAEQAAGTRMAQIMQAIARRDSPQQCYSSGERPC